MPRDHPRIRGEHKETPMYIEIDYGSSPHTRGAPDARLLDLPHDGIIPAYAGSTRRRVEVPEYRSDHPRIRGEHWGSTTGSWSSRGSSPHTRGAPVRKGKRSGPVGIIPAYAGSTRDRGFSLGCDGDHPRIRGEHACEALYGARPGGSSPHPRGARAFEVAWRGCRGIIPAYAGSTRRDMRRNSSHLSSSPHTRGALE